jgi:hypothetical protein
MDGAYAFAPDANPLLAAMKLPLLASNPPPEEHPKKEEGQPPQAPAAVAPA